MSQQTLADQGGAGALVDARQSLGLAQLDDLFPEGAAFRASLQTFAVLLALSAFIAAFGLYQDSVASIIGAMVVAPLGGAILAFAGSLVSARSRWQWIAIAQVMLGALGVIAIGFLVAAVLPDPLTLTPSMDARTQPNLLDLGVALSAGAAGAWVAVRHTGTDSLPGVAIAVSLVPPLSTVGICLELGLPEDAAGALLLFVTNFAAIVVSACVVFTLAGAAPDVTMRDERRRMRNGIVGALILLGVIAVPLLVSSVQHASNLLRAATATPVVDQWLGDRDLRVDDWSVDGTTLNLTLSGPDEPPDPETLAAQLASLFDQPVTVDVDYLRTRVTSGSANP